MSTGAPPTIIATPVDAPPMAPDVLFDKAEIDAKSGDFKVTSKGGKVETTTRMKLDLVHGSRSAKVDSISVEDQDKIEKMIEENEAARTANKEVDVKKERMMIARQIREYCSNYLQTVLGCMFEYSPKDTTVVVAAYVDTQSNADTKEILAFLNVLFMTDLEITQKLGSDADAKNVHKWDIPRYKKFVMDSFDPKFNPGFAGSSDTPVAKSFAKSMNAKKLPNKTRHPKDSKISKRMIWIVIILIILYFVWKNKTKKSE